jgi:hypothetical protein
MGFANGEWVSSNRLLNFARRLASQPLSLDALGNFFPQPSFADVAEPPPLILPNNASAAERGLLLTEYGFRLRAHDFAEKAKLAINGPFSELKQFLINPIIWGEEVARIAQGTGYDQVTDPPYVIYMRIRDALAHL